VVSRLSWLANGYPESVACNGVEMQCASAMVLGYPKFKQDGVVPREYRPLTWFREGAKGPEIEE
jgi:hypothetical protein